MPTTIETTTETTTLYGRFFLPRLISPINSINIANRVSLWWRAPIVCSDRHVDGAFRITLDSATISVRQRLLQ